MLKINRQRLSTANFCSIKRVKSLLRNHRQVCRCVKKRALQSKHLKSTKEKHPAPAKPMSKIVQLVEEDDDLVPYEKPDSDPEDDDEDPTLVSREKLRPPV